MSNNNLEEEFTETADNQAPLVDAIEGLVLEALDYIKEMLDYQLSELVNNPSPVSPRNPSHEEVPLMCLMFPNNPMDWDTLSKKPQQKGSVPPEVNPSEV